MAAPANHPADRFTTVFSAFMVFCVLVWLWGLGLYLVWPWQKGGEWLPDFPIVAVCADDQVCALPYGELAAAQAAGKVKTLVPPSDTGETTYELINLQWKRLKDGVETKASTWHFQTTVRYRIENERPILASYQEISGKVFLIAIIGALISTVLLYLRKLRK